MVTEPKGYFMWYVYVLESDSSPGKFYTGFTEDLQRRIKEHNSIDNKGHTAKYRPWSLHTYVCFSNKVTARNFEIYLKTQAGRRFQKLRFQKN